MAVKTEVPVLDWQALLPAARQGDAAAIRTIYTGSQPIINRALQTRSARLVIGSDVDLIASSVSDTLMTDIIPNGKINFDLPEGVTPEKLPALVDQMYKGFVTRVTRRKFADHLRESGRAQITYIDIPTHSNVEIAPELVDKHGGADVVFDRQQETELFNAWRLGLNSAQLCKLLSLSVTDVNILLVNVRQRLFEEYLKPNGIQSIDEWPINSYTMQHRLRKGQLRGAQLVHRWFTSADWVADYERDYKQPPSNGYSPLTDVLPYDHEHYKLVIHHLGAPELGTIIRNGRVYVRKESVPAFLASMGKNFSSSN